VLASLDKAVGQGAPIQLAQHRCHLDGLCLGPPDEVNQWSIAIAVVSQ